MSSPHPAGFVPGARSAVGRVARRLHQRSAPMEPEGPSDTDIVVAEVRAGQAETRVRIEALVRADAESRAQGAAELLRILSDQSVAVDDVTEVFGRMLAGLAADVAALRDEVAQLRESLTGGTAGPPAGSPDRAVAR